MAELRHYTSLRVGGPAKKFVDAHNEKEIVAGRPELVNITGQVVDYELSDYVKLRLVLARKKALERYHEKWG